MKDYDIEIQNLRAENEELQKAVAELLEDNNGLQKQLDARCDFCIERERKQTAREILQILYDQCYEYNPRLPEESIGHIIPIDILTLADKYGVEVEE